MVPSWIRVSELLLRGGPAKSGSSGGTFMFVCVYIYIYIHRHALTMRALVGCRAEGLRPVQKSRIRSPARSALAGSITVGCRSPDCRAFPTIVRLGVLCSSDSHELCGLALLRAYP